MSSGGETVIYVLDLSTPYDIYTATVDFSKKRIFDLYHSDAVSFIFKPDGNKLFMLERGSANGGTTDAVYEYKTGFQLVDLLNSKGTSNFDGAYSSLTGAPAAGVTQSDIDTSIANLVDSAPATLDTLNELAAALGDDVNFSTTVTNSIANKQDKVIAYDIACLLYTSPSPRDLSTSRMPSSA